MKFFLSFQIILIVFTIQKSKAQLFSQNFTSSGSVSNYIDNANPGTTKFNSITGGLGTNLSIVSNALRFEKLGNIPGSFSRTIDFPGPPTLLSVKFTLAVSGNNTAQTKAAELQIGRFFTTNNDREFNVSTHSCIGIDLTATNGVFALRHIDAGESTVGVAGPQNITFIINNNDAVASYMAPDGSTESVDNDTWDLWVGTTKVFDNKAATSANNDLTDLKFAFVQGIGNIDITNILVDNLQTVLPVNLTYFKGNSVGPKIELNWQTLSEHNNAFFEILSSNNPQNFKVIGKIMGAGNAQNKQNYYFTDNNPYPNTNYYQLKQVDFNGNVTAHSVIAIENNALENNFKISTNKLTNEVELTVFAKLDCNSTFKVFDLSGHKILDKRLRIIKGFNFFNISLKGINTGLHIATLAIDNKIISNKFIME